MAREKDLFGNTLFLGAANFFCKLLSFLLLPIFTAKLEPAAFGTVDILITTALLLIPVASLNAPEALFRFLARDKGEGRGAVAAGGILLLFVGVLLFLLLSPLLGFFAAIRPYRGYLICYVLASVARSLFLNIYRAAGYYRAVAIQQSFCAVLTAAAQLVFLFVWELGVGGYLSGVILGDLITAIFLAVGLFLKKHSVKPGLDKAVFREMLAYALPLIPTTALWWGSAALDRYMLLFYHGERAIGLYAAASRLPALLSLAVSIFLEAWHYTATRVAPEGRGALFYRIYRLLLPFLLLGTAMLMAGGRGLVFLLFDDAYRDALLPLPYLLLAALFSGLSHFLGSAYNLTLRSASALATATLGVAVNLLFNFLLIPTLGTRGAAIGTLLSWLAVFLWRLFDVSRAFLMPRHLLPLALSFAALLGAALTGERLPVLSIVSSAISLLPVLPLLFEGTAFLWRRARAFLAAAFKYK